MQANKQHNIRGRKPQDDPEIIKIAIRENKEKLICEGQLRPPSDSIWQEIKQKYKIIKTEKAIYTCVSCNRWNLKYDLGLLKRKIQEENEEIEELDSEDAVIGLNEKYDEEDALGNSKDVEEEAEDGELDNICFMPKEQPSASFQIHIPKEKWKVIEPEERVYVRNISKDPKRKTAERKYLVLKSGIWTDVFNNLVWDAIKWPCTWSFKGNYVSTSEETRFWIVVRAKCGCGNMLNITSQNPPPMEPLTEGVSLDVKVWGSKESHFIDRNKKVRKRPFAGGKRRQLGKEMIYRNVKPSRIRKEMASGIMSFQDPEPAHLPSAEVSRRIRHEAVQSRRLDNDPIKSLQSLKRSRNPVYMFTIHDIGLDPFFVHITPDYPRLPPIRSKSITFIARKATLDS